MHQNSVCQETWYFFSVTGINITQKLVNSLQGHTSKKVVATEELINLDKHLLHHLDKLKNEAEFGKVMGLMYMLCMVEFDKAWCAGRPTNIMNFTQFLGDIFVGRFEKAIPMGLQAHFKKANKSADASVRKE